MRITKNIQLIGGKYEQHLSKLSCVRQFLEKLALTNSDNNAEILSSDFKFSPSALPGAFLALRGAHVIADNDGVEAYRTVHHVTHPGGANEEYVFQAEEDIDTIRVSNGPHLRAVKLITVAGVQAIDRAPTSPIAPPEQQQKRPE